jgi:hypothetical protein
MSSSSFYVYTLSVNVDDYRAACMVPHVCMWCGPMCCSVRRFWAQHSRIPIRDLAVQTRPQLAPDQRARRQYDSNPRRFSSSTRSCALTTALPDLLRATWTPPRYLNSSTLPELLRSTWPPPCYLNSSALPELLRATWTPPRYLNSSALPDLLRATWPPRRYLTSSALPDLIPSTWPPPRYLTSSM